MKLVARNNEDVTTSLRGIGVGVGSVGVSVGGVGVSVGGVGPVVAWLTGSQK